MADKRKHHSSATRACRELKLPVVRRAHLVPYEKFLRGIGAPVDRYLERARLPIRDEPTVEYMSNRGYFEFVGIAAHEQGIPDFGYRACMPVGRTRLSGELLRRMERSPTLYRALKEFVVGIHEDASHIRMGLVEEPSQVLFWQRSAPEAGQVGWDISEQLVAVLLIDLVRLFAGPRWYPQTIRCRAPLVPTVCQEHLPNTQLHGGAQALTIPIPRRLLHLPPLHGRVGRAVSDSRIDYPEDLPAALREVMKGYLRGGRARLEFAAEIAGTSPRSLQRRLKDCGTTFGRVLEQARFQVSAELLADPQVQAIDVANAAGYSDPSNFSRAFRRMAGVSPTEYKDSLAGAK
jgi:AraC-like DNA-binding protein